jgi:hypothetical protein
VTFASAGSSEESRVLLSEKEDKGDDQAANFILPVFPLRKSVKIPSEALTLNLYEERYLALSKYVLEHEPRRFGALYCSNKPQFIKDGNGPIVPMVDPGDVGVVCAVLSDEQAMVPISLEDGGLRRRIKLRGLAVGRFRIEKVLYNGYGGGSLCSRDEKVEPLPFIVVEASRVVDLPIETGSEEEKRLIDLETKLYASILERDGKIDNMAIDLWEELVCDDEPGDGDKCNLVARRFAPLLPSHLRKEVDADTTLAQNRDLIAIEQALYSWATDSVSCLEDQRRQLFSFALSATASPEKSADDALGLLRTTSTYERLQRAHDEFKKNRSLLSSIKLML